MTVEQRMERFTEALDLDLDLAARAPVGRIAHRRYAMPAVFIVGFQPDGRDVVFDEAAREDWMATFLGRAQLITDPVEQARPASASTRGPRASGTGSSRSRPRRSSAAGSRTTGDDPEE